MNKPAPVFSHLHKLRVSWSGWIGLIHRLSGVVLFFSLPVLIYLLQLSLKSHSGFEQVVTFFEAPASIVLQTVYLAFFTFHILSGIRRVFQDSDIGLDQSSATRSAQLIVIVTLFVSALFLVIRLL